jgi:hypothetical protein
MAKTTEHKDKPVCDGCIFLGSADQTRLMWEILSTQYHLIFTV